MAKKQKQKQAKKKKPTKGRQVRGRRPERENVGISLGQTYRFNASLEQSAIEAPEESPSVQEEARRNVEAAE